MLPNLNVLSLIPQQPPFVMISELLSADEKLTRTRFYISEENVFTEKGCFTEPGLVENIAQTAAAGAGYRAQTANQPVENGFITVVKNLEIYELPAAGQELTTEVEIQDQIFNTTLITGKIYCGEQLIASCEMSIMIQQAQHETEGHGN